MRKRLLSILTIIALLSTLFNYTLPTYAATSKSGMEVKGVDVLNALNMYNISLDAYNQDYRPEIAVVIQTRAFASIRGNGNKAINYGLLLDRYGTEAGEKPELISKDNRAKDCYKYITNATPQEYVVTFTDSNEPKNTLFQKNSDYDAYLYQDCYFGYLASKEIEDNISVNINGVLDETANAQYVDPYATYRVYVILDPTTEEGIGYFFVEKKAPLAEQNPKTSEGGGTNLVLPSLTPLPPLNEGHEKAEPTSSGSENIFIGDSRTIDMFSDTDNEMSGTEYDGYKVYAKHGYGFDYMKSTVESIGRENIGSLTTWMGANDAGDFSSYEQYYEELLADGINLTLCTVGGTDDSHLASYDHPNYENSKMVAFNNSLQSWASSHGVSVIDTYTYCKNNCTLDTADGIHYTPRPTNNIWQFITGNGSAQSTTKPQPKPTPEPSSGTQPQPTPNPTPKPTPVIENSYTEVQPESETGSENSTPPLPTISPVDPKEAPVDTDLNMGKGVLHPCGLWYTAQNAAGHWDSVKNNAGETMAAKGCAIFSLWAAAFNSGHTNEQLADALWDLYGPNGTGDLQLNSDGVMYGNMPAGIGRGKQIWEDLRARWGVEVGSDISVSHFSEVPSTGKYLVWYQHYSNNAEKCHWVYVQDGCVVSASSEAPNGTIAELSDKVVRHCMPVN